MEKSVSIVHFMSVSELWCKHHQCYAWGVFEISATSVAAQVDYCLMRASLVDFCQQIACLLV